MIIDMVLLLIAVALTLAAVVSIVVLGPATRRRAALNRRLERDAEIERLQRELHLDQ